MGKHWSIRKPRRHSSEGRERGDREDPHVRFWRKVEKTDGCWLWKGSVAMTYGYFHLYYWDDQRDGWKHTGVVAHRLAYLDMVGDIPKGLVLDHLCGNRLCVRPDHLEPVTQRENLRRSNNHVGAKMRQTHCIRGHALLGPNLGLDKRGYRFCKTCTKSKI